MFVRNQSTLSRTVEFSGIGVHTGLPSTIKIHPAKENFGILFKRVDVEDRNNSIKVKIENVVNTEMCTKISNAEGVVVSVIEHLMAALKISGITNALIEINAEEVPIMDGSALEFVTSFTKSGIVKQSVEVKTITVKKPISIEFDNGSISAVPCKNSIIEVSLDYNRINKVIQNNNSVALKMSDKEKLIKIAESRTFGWLEDYDKIRAKGLAKGSSADNTVIIGVNGDIINMEGLRNKKEIVSHKALDMIGDLSVSGYDIIGRIFAKNPSHLQNHYFLRKFIAQVRVHNTIGCDDTEDSFKSRNCVQEIAVG
jgi:UDP-3-O-[3-hydroxymyristoyl] N-acetylglucosamine deacetylase